jgi:hypothetical protein
MPQFAVHIKLYMRKCRSGSETSLYRVDGVPVNRLKHMMHDQSQIATNKRGKQHLPALEDHDI